MLRVLAVSILLSLSAVSATLADDPKSTLTTIRTTKHLACGVVSEQDDWNGQDIHGNLSPLGAEICRAVAIAILGDESGLDIRDYPAEPEALAGLKANAIQLAVGISPSVTNAVLYGIGFGPPVFYDSQRILTSITGGITSLSGLKDQLICAMDGTQAVWTLREELSARGIPFALQAHSEQGEMDAAVAVHRCQAGTAMESRLAQSRANFHALVSDFVFLPDRFGLEPVVPAYRYGDQTFGLIVDWTIHALIEAEALGITQDNVTQAGRREDTRAQQLLGGDPQGARALGLAPDWSVKMIAGVGNYGEIFRRSIARPYHLERGPNDLWTRGGLMRPLPMR